MADGWQRYLEHLSGIVGSQQEFFPMGKSGDQLEMQVIHHRGSGHELSAVRLASRIDLRLEVEVKVLALDALVAQASLVKLHFGNTDPGKALCADVEIAFGIGKIGPGGQGLQFLYRGR